MRSTIDARRVPLMFLADAEQQAPRRNGMELSAHEIVVHGPGSTNHLRHAGRQSTGDDVARASTILPPQTMAIIGREMAPSAPRPISSEPAA